VVPGASPLDEPTAIYSQFDADEARVLRTFAEDVDAFVNATFFKDLQLSLTVGVEGSGASSGEDLEYPGEESVRAIAGLFRSLYEPNEHASFHAVLNLLSRHVIEKHPASEEQVLAIFRDLKRWKKRALSPRGLRIEVNGKEMLPRDLIETFLYGKYLHKQPEKVALLSGFAPIGMLQLEFLTTMQILSKLYGAVAREVVRPVLATPALFPAGS
jgi:hypothetical protein